MSAQTFDFQDLPQEESGPFIDHDSQRWTSMNSGGTDEIAYYVEVGYHHHGLLQIPFTLTGHFFLLLILFWRWSWTASELDLSIPIRFTKNCSTSACYGHQGIHWGRHQLVSWYDLLVQNSQSLPISSISTSLQEAFCSHLTTLRHDLRHGLFGTGIHILTLWKRDADHWWASVTEVMTWFCFQQDTDRLHLSVGCLLTQPPLNHHQSSCNRMWIVAKKQSP